MAVEIKVNYSCNYLGQPLTKPLAQMGIFAKH
jgi:hypothetical protein